MRLDSLKRFVKTRTPSWVYWLLRKLQRKLAPSLRLADREEHRFLASFIHEGDLCFDIGCHLGRKARAMRQCGARVIGVEPDPLAQRICSHEFRGDDEFVLVPAGLADKPGKMTLYRASNLSMTSFRSDWSETDHQIEVEVTTLDSLISNFGSPDFCKIDVEGFEESVLSGLTTPIPLVSFEFHQSKVKAAVNCLLRLKRLGARTANVTPMDSIEFAFPEFIGIEQMIQFIKEDWEDGSRGDIYVKTDCPERLH